MIIYLKNFRSEMSENAMDIDSNFVICLGTQDPKFSLYSG